MNRYQTRPRGLGLAPSVRSRTRVLGVGYAEIRRDGRLVAYFTANGPRGVRKFNVTRLGRDEAFRRAVKLRADYEMSRKGINP